MNKQKYVDVSYKSLNKYTEELCGDRVEIVNTENGVIIVLSDGLGSGVKANILSTLTSKIISTMMKEGADIEDTVDTIVKTLPVCSVRNLAYSTFSILQISHQGEVYLVEFDNPGCIFIKDGKLSRIEYTLREIAGKNIKEARFNVNESDELLLISDGVVYAGVGALLNLGWSWDNVADFAVEKFKQEKTSARMTSLLSEACADLYMNEPGDDTTVVTAKIIPKKVVNIFSGPPERIEDDERAVSDFMQNEGLKVVCGGSTANITSRILKESITTELNYINPNIPPIARIKGIDLVTEGVLTLRKALEIIKKYLDDPTEKININLIDESHGASLLAKILMEECTHLHLFIGKKINPAHQNPNLPVDLSIKLRLLEDLYNVMEKAGKVVERKYY
ncbi:stage II sporulation protein E [Sebaldella termitidis]|uniref:Protein serine/threonine phosphatase n=1 Tax=Sebaldella termitidis (strain ATCC 33386 / NCTC 11300) TaxID=526218 RepID=D1AQP3_SEBTE|nr:SpoIIE family protein phosphatase [Sebaldella termitidis]ACZ10303.1 protein serine/threonine phosphatase [Sebaldella termitidis ATCC 33386]SUI25642.1 stage II sporulation protein E [Sebaldella termitidis]